MEEVYRQLRLNPPVDPRTRDDDCFSSRDLEIVQDIVSDVCGPLADEHESWWEDNGEELERVVMGVTSGSLRSETRAGKMPLVWAWSELCDGVDDRSSKSEVETAFSLTAYKAGGAEMLEGGDSTFERTPMALYWDSLPDVASTKRVYAHNAVDRMAALKYMMNCTDNDMHGKAGTRLVRSVITKCGQVQDKPSQGFEVQKFEKFVLQASREGCMRYSWSVVPINCQDPTDADDLVKNMS